MDVIVVLLALLFVVAGTVVAARATRAAKRGVERTVASTRRTVGETALKARRAVRPGPMGDIARLRLGVRTSIDSTRRELEDAVAADPGLRESIGLLDRLHDYARQLDDELRHLEREPDKARVEERLPELRSRAERIRHSADSLRWAAQDRARHAAVDTDGLEELTAQIDVETGALRHWAPASSEAAGSAGPAASQQAVTSGNAGRTGPASQDAFHALLAKIERLRKRESA